MLHGRLHALGPGKDSTAGHWELMGVVAAARAADLSRGAAARALLARVEAAIGTPVICNRALQRRSPRSRTTARSTSRSGRPILYTSQDSVVQLAAHVSVMAPDALYAACAALRRELAGATPSGA